ncbi:DMT family transporter [Haloparvum sedimenti]|uniref:DMT family transporter n=1 Tax=Haloparvum sedimenti TaxID=1678448 RepID=UPI00071E7E7D|nr:EamA family transporter [Haloparvum sedimenti]
MTRDISLSTPAVAIAAFVTLAVLWGGSFVAIEAGLHFFPPLLFAGVRYLLAGLVVLGYAAVVSDRWIPRDRTEWGAVAVAGTLVIAAYHALLYVGELHISGAVAAVLVSLSPVLTAAFAAALLPSQRLGPVELGGFLLGVVGVVVVADPSLGTLLSGGSTELFGAGLVLAGAATFALGAVLLRPLRNDFSIVPMQGWAMVVGAVVLFAGAGVRGESPAAVVWNATTVVTLAYLTILSGVIAFLIYFALLDEVGPAQLHLVGYAEPITAALISWLVLGHLIEGRAMVGFLVILAGFLVVERHAVRRVVDARTPRDADA